MNLSSSASEHNVFVRTYVCMINEVKPNDVRHTDGKPISGNIDINDAEGEISDKDDDQIKVLRSRALHELVDTHADDDGTILGKDPKVTNLSPNPTTSSEESESTDDQEGTLIEDSNNANILKLTKMKWLSEGREGSPDSRSPSLSPVSSSTSSQYSRESQTNLQEKASFADKHLTTILRLDKEHNLFGLSNIAIIGTKTSKRTCKKDTKAVFHQTAIVQICCGTGCCKNPSNTDLPPSLKCGGCRGCCNHLCNNFCLSCDTCENPATCCQAFCKYRKGMCKYKGPCPSTKCITDCTNCYGLKIAVKRKPQYEPTYVELTPRSSCVLAKPQAARSCHHLPQCMPPSSCFPYLMPCYWPARAGAPCTNPMRCFHNPPCPPPRRPRSRIPLQPSCPPKCEDSKHTNKCTVPTCPGPEGHQTSNDNGFSSETQIMKKKKKKRVYCECSTPHCVSCFVLRPILSFRSVAVQKRSSNRLIEHPSQESCEARTPANTAEKGC